MSTKLHLKDIANQCESNSTDLKSNVKQCDLTEVHLMADEDPKKTFVSILSKEYLLQEYCEIVTKEIQYRFNDKCKSIDTITSPSILLSNLCKKVAYIQPTIAHYVKNIGS